MVASIEDLQLSKEKGLQSGLVIELIGPAGAGKSTVYKALQKKAPWIIGEYLPPIWKISYIPFDLINILSLTPTLLHIFRKSNKHLTRQQLAYMIILNGWHKIIRDEVYKSSQVILLDQGPIYIMAYLLRRYPQDQNNSPLNSWWNQVFDRWFHTLDMIVYLDTKNDTLINRIHGRQDKVIGNVNGKSEQEAWEFLEIFRTVYEQIIIKSKSINHRMLVVRIDSGENDIEKTIEIIISEIESYKQKAF